MDPVKLNLWVAWIAMLCGALSGAVQGLFFRNEQWWGGYASWRRRIRTRSSGSMTRGAPP